MLLCRTKPALPSLTPYHGIIIFSASETFQDTAKTVLLNNWWTKYCFVFFYVRVFFGLFGWIWKKHFEQMRVMPIKYKSCIYKVFDGQWTGWFRVKQECQPKNSMLINRQFHVNICQSYWKLNLSFHAQKRYKAKINWFSICCWVLRIVML